MKKLKDLNPEELPVGSSYEVFEPKYFGSFPVRQELTIMPADEIKSERSLPPIKIYAGVEIRTMDDKVLINKEDLKPGKQFKILGFFGETRIMEAHIDEYGSFSLEDAGVIAPAEFDKDDRHCWTVTSIINKRALDKIAKANNERA